MTSPLRTLATLILMSLLIPGCVRLDRLLKPWSAPGGVAGRVERIDRKATTSELASQSTSASGTVLVYLEAIGAPSPGRRDELVEWFVIENERQEPELRLVHPDQPVRFRNSDSIHHELFTLDPHNRFQIRLEEGEESEPVHFGHPGFVKAFCRLHPSETYTLIVSDAIHFDQLDVDSRYHISDVPAGEYQIRATSLDMQSEPFVVRIVSGETIERTLRLSAESMH